MFYRTATTTRPFPTKRGFITGEGIILLEFYTDEVFFSGDFVLFVGDSNCYGFINQTAFSKTIPSFCHSSLLLILLSVSDRLSTGIVVADIDLSLVDSVREKMPIAKVIIYNVYIHPTNTREWNGMEFRKNVFLTFLFLLIVLIIEAVVLLTPLLLMHTSVPFRFSKGSHLTSGKLLLYSTYLDQFNSHKGVVYFNVRGVCTKIKKNMGLPYLIILRMVYTMLAVYYYKL